MKSRPHLFILFCILIFSSYAQTWEKALIQKEAKLDLVWYTSVPFIYNDNKGNLVGIENELLSLFQEYVSERYGVALTLNWHEHTSFAGILDTIQAINNANLFGVSAFSITEERSKLVQFSEPYLPDVTVLVSSVETPILTTDEEVAKMLKDMEAVTIKGTTYEKLLSDLRDQSGINFDIIYINSDNSILLTIKEADNRFGFIDLPIYLMLIKNGGELTRQNNFTFQGIGYGFTMSKDSDWKKPLNEFLNDSRFAERIRAIKSKYLGPELFAFIDQLKTEQELATSILTKEKEIQLALIRNANMKLQEGESNRRILIGGIFGILLFLIIIAFLFINNQKNTKRLIVQKSQIEAQKVDIKDKNRQLQQRNSQLIHLNEDKNNLVRVLAHDLRSPLNQIIGFGDILTSQPEGLNQDHKIILERIVHAADRMEQMISKILDVNNVERPQAMVLKEKVHMEGLLNEISDHFKPMTGDKKLILNMSKINGQVSLETDRLMLVWVLEQLVSNAINCSPQSAEINMNIELVREAVVFEVKDQGPGLSEQDQKNAFQRVQKANGSSSENETAIGPGLSIVKKYVRDLEGTVWVQSELGSGSSFFVSLPV